MHRRRGVLSLGMLLTGVVLISAAAFARTDASDKNGGTFRISATPIDSIDPAITYGPSADYLDAACAKLFRLADVPGRAAYRIVPEAASAFPKVSADGKTYTFVLRRTLRFNTGSPLKASGFAQEINRVLNPVMNSPDASLFADIVGAQAVLAGKATRVRGIHASGYTLTVRLVRPVPDLVARLTVQGACSVLPALPADPEGAGAPLAAAGPYYIAQYVPAERLILRRNRYYHGSRPHHVDRFVVTIVDTEQTALDQVLAGKADWAPVDPSGLTPQQRAQGRFFKALGGFVFYLSMNTSRPLFRNNVPLRRAVNFVIERDALRAVYGGPAVGTLTDHYLGSGVPGYRSAHIYPLKKPNLRRAQALAKGHTRSGKAVLYTHDTGPTVPAGKIIQRDLAKIGIDVEIKAFPGEQYFTRIFTLGEPYDLAIFGWSPDYPDPFDVLNELFTGTYLHLPQTGNFSRFDSPRYNRLLAAAGRLSGSARYRAYGNLDVMLARDAAPAAAFFNGYALTFVSRRTGCIVLHSGLDLAAVCLR